MYRWIASELLYLDLSPSGIQNKKYGSLVKFLKGVWELSEQSALLEEKRHENFKEIFESEFGDKKTDEEITALLDYLFLIPLTLTSRPPYSMTNSQELYKWEKEIPRIRPGFYIVNEDLPVKIIEFDPKIRG